MWPRAMGLSTAAFALGQALGPSLSGLAGDAFGKPRVQSAWRSGRDLGRALAARLG